MDDVILWLEQYITHRNLITKDLVEIKKEEGKIIAIHKEKEVAYLLLPQLDSSALQHKGSVVCANSKKNLDFLIEHWKEFVAGGQTLLFVNPASQWDTKWIITPAVHDRITDEKHLRQGLKAMFETVEQV